MDFELRQQRRMATLAELVSRYQGTLGRTALMKMVYLLQVVKGVPLEYNFSMYAYGPYSTDVLHDLGVAENYGYIQEAVVVYNDGYGYDVKPGKHIEFKSMLAGEFLIEHEREFKWVIQEFGNYKAADMELIGTMVMVDRDAMWAGEELSEDQLASSVQSVKPKYPKEKIQALAKEMAGKQLFEATKI